MYSYSKYFGCTGWRLGVIAVDDNIFDDMIAKHPRRPEEARQALRRADLEPRKIKFIDRIVADSRDIALNHTAGLSLPSGDDELFSLAELMDDKKATRRPIDIVKKRVQATIEGSGSTWIPTRTSTTATA